LKQVECRFGITPSLHWRRGSESNRRIRLLQSPALPLGYPAALSDPQTKSCPLTRKSKALNPTIKKRSTLEPRISLISRMNQNYEALALQAILSINLLENRLVFQNQLLPAKSLNGRSRSTDEVVDCRSKSSDSFNGRSHQRAECPPTEGRIYGISPTADRLVGQPCRPVSHPSHLAAATPDRSTDIGHRFRRLGSRFPWRQFKSANRLVVIMHPGCRCPGLNRHRQLQPLRA
jgi:hypothetical protein